MEESKDNKHNFVFTKKKLLSSVRLLGKKTKDDKKKKITK